MPVPAELLTQALTLPAYAQAFAPARYGDPTYPLDGTRRVCGVSILLNPLDNDLAQTH